MGTKDNLSNAPHPPPEIWSLPLGRVIESNTYYLSVITDKSVLNEIFYYYPILYLF